MIDWVGYRTGKAAPAAGPAGGLRGTVDWTGYRVGNVAAAPPPPPPPPPTIATGGGGRYRGGTRGFRHHEPPPEIVAEALLANLTQEYGAIHGREVYWAMFREHKGPFAPGNKYDATQQPIEKVEVRVPIQRIPPARPS